MRVRAFPQDDEFVAADDIPSPITSEIAAASAAAGAALAPPRGTSITQINAWTRCRLEWAFAYRSRLARPERDPSEPYDPTPIEIGSGIHAVLESAGRVRVEGHTEAPKVGARELLKHLQAVSSDWPKALTDAVAELVLPLVPIDMGRVRLVEHPHVLDLAREGEDPIPIALVMDRVDVETDNTTTVIDYKKGAARRRADLEAEPQTAIYLGAAQALWPGRPVRMRYHFIQDRAVVEIPFDQDLVDWGLYRARKVALAMHDPLANLVPTVGTQCGSCSFVARCKAGARWVSQSLLGPTPPDGAGAFQVAVADALAASASDEELADTWLKARAIEDAAKAVRVTWGREIRQRLGGRRAPDWGKYDVRLGRRKLMGFHWSVLPGLAKIMGVSEADAARITDGLKRERTIAWCKTTPAAMAHLKRHEHLDTATWVEVHEKKS